MSLDVTILKDWAPVASAALAAVAAAAAWMNVRQARRQWLLAQSPRLVPQIVRAPSGVLELHVLNAGSGLARQLQCCVVAGDSYIVGYVGPNFGGVLKSDETQVVTTALPDPAPTLRGIVTCVDSAGRAHSFDLDGRHRVRRRGPSLGDPEAWPRKMLELHYPGTDLARIQRVHAQTLIKPAS